MSGSFEDLFETAPCGYVVLTSDRKVIQINRTLADWLGCHAESQVGKPFNDLLGFGGRIAFETHLAPMLRLQGKVGEIALDLLAADGTKIPMIANASEVTSEDGQHLRTRLTLFKATDRRAYEQSLIAARDQARAISALEHETAILREQFIAVLGHDLRNPLAALEAGARILARETLSERGRFVVREMGQSIVRATSLIDNVLDFARGRLGEGLIINRDRLEPLTPILEQVVAEVRAIHPGRTIVTDFHINEPLNCDRQRIGQLAANLISNAVAHGTADVPIEVTARTEKDFVLSVTNGGDPIPQEARDRLFEPFFRGGFGRGHQGLGLGLFIVSEIAKAHNGTIEVVSTDGSTTFLFSMPLTDHATA